MGSKINRGFMFYFFLLTGILLGVFLVCVVIMIFVPEFSVFGIRCVNENYQNVRITEMAVYSNTEETTEIDSVLLNSSSYNIEKIDISSNVHSVKVFKSNNTQGVNFNQFVVIFNSKSFGFTTSEKRSSSLSVRYYTDTKTLRIEATGPESFLNFGENLSIIVQVPPEYSTDNIDLKINTRSNISLGDSYNKDNLYPSIIDFKSVDLQTSAGAISVTNYTTIGENARDNCILKTANNNIEINTIIKANDLTIETGEGTLKFNSEEQSFNLTGNLSIKTNNTFVHLGEIVAKNIYLNNTYGKFYFTKDLTGNVYINKQSSNCAYEFLNITGNLTVGSYLDEDMVEGGILSIEEFVTGNVLIAMTGHISIGETLSLTQIKGTNGDITIKDVNAAIQINTVNGNIILGNKENKVESPIDLQCTGNGDVTVYFGLLAFIVDTSRIDIEKGKVDIYLTKNMNRNITATATKSLTYLGVDIESKTGHWVIGEARDLSVTSNDTISIQLILED